MKPTIHVIVCDNYPEAEAAIQKLLAAGFELEGLNVLGLDLETGALVQDHPDLSRKRAGRGALEGGLLGLLVGAALLAVPGLGPVAILGSCALGAFEGAVLGGGLEALHRDRLLKEVILPYKAQLQAGKFLLVVQRKADERNNPEEILAGSQVQARG